MPYIVKKLVPVYSQFDKVPKKYYNLRKAVYVTTFKYLYPSIPKILIEQYGLSPDEKIVVFWTKEVSLPHFNRYRVRFRKVYSGLVRDFGKYMGKVRRRGTKQGMSKTG
ncbi:MAG: hypothetical protein KAR42_04775 [candidate division Zixibacteria bacterium]|nr:hypothetical protein [candidate division Zixibacteria bacterium]